MKPCQGHLDPRRCFWAEATRPAIPEAEDFDGSLSLANSSDFPKMMILKFQWPQDCLPFKKERKETLIFLTDICLR